MKKNQVKKSIAKKLSWQQGGAHRIAYEKRLHDTKTSALVHRTSAPASKVIGHQESATASPKHYPMPAIIRLMQMSAYMLLIADKDRPELNELNGKQAEMLMAAVADLTMQGSGQ